MYPRIALTIDQPTMKAYRNWPDMLEAFVGVDAHPIMVSVDYGSPTNSRSRIENCDALVLTGGGDIDPQRYGDHGDIFRGVNRERDAIEFALLEEALDRKLPVLGICRGAQVINVAYGGDLYSHLEPSVTEHPNHDNAEEYLREPAHTVALTKGSVLADWCGSNGTFKVNSAHHQAVRNLGSGLKATAYASDGLIEGFENPDGRVVGVQWHPEFYWMVDRHSRALLHAFVANIQRA